MRNSAYIYDLCPSPDRQANNAILFFAWSPKIRNLPPLTKWVNSSEGGRLYERLIETLRNSRSVEQLLLTLAALVCFVRLLSWSPDETTEPVQGCYLADWDTLLKKNDLHNKPAVVKHISFSLLRFYETMGEHGPDEKHSQLLSSLVEAIDTEPPLLHPFDGFSDRYWAARIQEQEAHDAVFNSTMEDCCLAAAGLKRRSEWVVV